MTIEVEKEDGTQKGPKIEVDLPTFDTQSDALLSLSKRAQRARQQIALLERDIEFEIGRLAHQLDAEAAVLRRLEHQILPLQRKRLALRQREESSSLCLRACLLYTSPSPRDQRGSRMPSSA